MDRGKPVLTVRLGVNNLVKLKVHNHAAKHNGFVFEESLLGSLHPIFYLLFSWSSSFIGRSLVGSTVVTQIPCGAAGSRARARTWSEPARFLRTSTSQCSASLLFDPKPTNWHFYFLTMANNDLPTLICPSLLSCDLARIAEDANNMLELGADWLVRMMYWSAVLLVLH